jgi:hypothetical protein
VAVALAQGVETGGVQGCAHDRLPVGGDGPDERASPGGSQAFTSAMNKTADGNLDSRLRPPSRGERHRRAQGDPHGSHHPGGRRHHRPGPRRPGLGAQHRDAPGGHAPGSSHHAGGRAGGGAQPAAAYRRNVPAAGTHRRRGPPYMPGPPIIPQPPPAPGPTDGPMCPPIDGYGPAHALTPTATTTASARVPASDPVAAA